MSEKTQDLFTAIENDDIKNIQQLLENGVDVTIQTQDGTNGLMKLAELRDKNLFLNAIKLIENKSNINEIINTSNQYGETILMQTARYFSDSDVSKKLIELGANIFARDITGSNPLMYACIHQNSDVVDLLLQHKSIPYETDNHGFTPLMTVAANNNVEIAKQLINYGAALNTQNECGDTALTIATQNENKEMVNFLLRANAARNLKNKDGKNARRIAYETENREILRLFVHQTSVFQKVVSFLSLGYKKEQHTR